MTNQNLENTFNYMTSDQPMMSSREIANLTEKRHADVLRDIRKIIESLDANLRLGFKSSTYKDSTGKSNRCYLLDKDSTLCLISGYDVNVRMKIIKRWQELEKQQVPKLPQTYLEALKALVKSEEEKQQLTQQLEEAQPKIEFHDQLFSENTKLSMNEFAKILTKKSGVKIGQNKMMAFLRRSNYLMEGRDSSERNKPYQKYMDLEWFEIEYVETPIGYKAQTFITPIGQKNLAKKVINYFTDL